MVRTLLPPVESPRNIGPSAADSSRSSDHCALTAGWAAVRAGFDNQRGGWQPGFGLDVDWAFVAVPRPATVALCASPDPLPASGEREGPAKREGEGRRRCQSDRPVPQLGTNPPSTL